jgi:hypothetical protein
MGGRQRQGGRGRGERDLIEAVLEDGVDLAVGAGGDTARPGEEARARIRTLVAGETSGERFVSRTVGRASEP